jgi:hypothetical protein
MHYNLHRTTLVRMGIRRIIYKSNQTNIINIKDNDSGRYRYPAYKTDGQMTASNCMPEVCAQQRDGVRGTPRMGFNTILGSESAVGSYH